MESAIQIQNVWKIFGNNSKEALNAIQNQKISKQEALEKYNSVIGVSNVSFEVKKGEIFCVMGLSGSGKSTLVRHINRLLEPTSGKILINNQEINSGNLIQINNFDSITISSTKGNNYILLLQARPINEPVVKYGPFVMNTRSEIQDAFNDYNKTGFGEWTWIDGGPVHGKKYKKFAIGDN